MNMPYKSNSFFTVLLTEWRVWQQTSRYFVRTAGPLPPLIIFPHHYLWTCPKWQELPDRNVNKSVVVRCPHHLSDAPHLQTTPTNPVGMRPIISIPLTTPKGPVVASPDTILMTMSTTAQQVLSYEAASFQWQSSATPRFCPCISPVRSCEVSSKLRPPHHSRTIFKKTLNYHCCETSTLKLNITSTSVPYVFMCTLFSIATPIFYHFMAFYVRNVGNLLSLVS